MCYVYRLFIPYAALLLADSLYAPPATTDLRPGDSFHFVSVARTTIDCFFSHSYPRSKKHDVFFSPRFFVPPRVNEPHTRGARDNNNYYYRQNFDRVSRHYNIILSRITGAYTRVRVILCATIYGCNFNRMSFFSCQ